MLINTLGLRGSCTRSTPGKVMRGRVAKAATQHFKFEGAPTFSGESGERGDSGR
jgi:hypothetical protein